MTNINRIVKLPSLFWIFNNKKNPKKLTRFWTLLQRSGHFLGGLRLKSLSSFESNWLQPQLGVLRVAKTGLVQIRTSLGRIILGFFETGQKDPERNSCRTVANLKIWQIDTFFVISIFSDKFIMFQISNIGYGIATFILTPLAKVFLASS